MLSRTVRWLIAAKDIVWWPPVRRWLLSDRSWPLFLLCLVFVYWLTPPAWWPFLTFTVIGNVYLSLVIAHGLEYWKVQRKRPNLLFITAYILFGLAILIGASITVPHPSWDVEAWRPASRSLWGIGLPFFAVAVWFECWRVGRLLWALWRRK